MQAYFIFKHNGNNIQFELFLNPNLVFNLPLFFSVSPPNPDTCGTPVIVDTRIVGGNVSIAGKWPWQVFFKGLSESSGSQATYCGGSLLSQQWVITAAHCTAG